MDTTLSSYASDASASDASASDEELDDKLILAEIYEKQPAEEKLDDQRGDWVWYSSTCVENM
jgi:hypothetical protein